MISSKKIYALLFWLSLFLHLPADMKLIGECPGKFADWGPGDELLNKPFGLANWGFNGELATRPLGLGCGIGLGLILVAMEVGEARLNEVAGLEPKLVWVGWPIDVWGLAGVWGFEPDGGVKGGWKRRPGSLCPAGDCGPLCGSEYIKKIFE